MSLYEINSMIKAIEVRTGKDGGGRPMTDDEFEASKDRWRALNLPDVVI